MGKWSKLATEFPALPYDEKVRAQADALRGTSIDGLTSAINDERLAKERLEDELKATNTNLEALYVALEEARLAANLDGFSANGYRWTPTIEPYPQVKDRVALRAWADEHIPEGLQLPWQTLRSMTKDALETGEPLPEGVEVYMKKAFTRTKQ